VAARLYWTVNSTAGTIVIGLAAKVSHPTPTRPSRPSLYTCAGQQLWLTHSRGFTGSWVDGLGPFVQRQYEQWYVQFRVHTRCTAPHNSHDKLTIRNATQEERLMMHPTFGWVGWAERSGPAPMAALLTTPPAPGASASARFYYLLGPLSLASALTHTAHVRHEPTTGLCWTPQEIWNPLGLARYTHLPWVTPFTSPCRVCRVCMCRVSCVCVSCVCHGVSCVCVSCTHIIML
jgi:hypothetical protein